MTADRRDALPTGWSVATIESLAEPRGVAYGVLKPGPNTPDGVPMLRVSDIHDSRVDPSAMYRIEPSLDAQYKRTKLRGGEVVLSIQGSVGRAAVVPGALAGANVSRTLAMIRLQEPKLARWVQKALESPAVQAAMRGAVGGTTRDSLNLRDLRRLSIPVAEADDRARILEYLDDLEARRASIVGRLAAIRLIVDRFRAAVLAAACSGRLTADWRDDHDEDIELLLRALKAATQGRPSPVAPAESDLVDDLPEKWRAVSLDLLIERVEAGRSVRAEGRPADPDEWGVIKVSAMSWGSFLEGENKAIVDAALIDSRYEIHSGDLLISRANTVDLVGATVHVDETRPRLLLSDKSLRLVPHEGIDKAWLNLALSSPASRSQLADRATGTSESMRNLSQPKILATTIALPPVAEQREIVRRATAALGTADGLARAIADAEVAVDGAQRGALAKAFRGDLILSSAEVTQPRHGAAS